jgi:hypothetical protein
MRRVAARWRSRVVRASWKSRAIPIILLLLPVDRDRRSFELTDRSDTFNIQDI